MYLFFWVFLLGGAVSFIKIKVKINLVPDYLKKKEEKVMEETKRENREGILNYEKWIIENRLWKMNYWENIEQRLMPSHRNSNRQEKKKMGWHNYLYNFTFYIKKTKILFNLHLKKRK